MYLYDAINSEHVDTHTRRPPENQRVERLLKKQKNICNGIKNFMLLEELIWVAPKIKKSAFASPSLNFSRRESHVQLFLFFRFSPVLLNLCSNNQGLVIDEAKTQVQAQEQLAAARG